MFGCRPKELSSSSRLHVIRCDLGIHHLHNAWLELMLELSWGCFMYAVCSDVQKQWGLVKRSKFMMTVW
jgi:hypothetical protein